MSDPRFFDKKGPFSAKELADLVHAELIGDPEIQIDDVGALSNANSKHVSFLDNRKYVKDFKISKAGLCIINPAFKDQAPEGMSLLLMDNPYMGYALVARHFYPESKPARNDISKLAHVAKTAIIGSNVIIANGASVGANAVIGNRTIIKPNAVIGDGVRIGDDCTISSNVTITHSEIGDGVVIHPGCQIGQDGFGFASGPEGHVRIPQLGKVIIHDHVNIGANTTIDRGAGPDTVIGAGTQIDNLVQIGHNVKMGQGCVIVSQVGISGSTEIGNFVVIGGQTGIAGHLQIGDGVKAAARSGIMRNVEAGQTIGGAPAINHKDWLREISVLRKLAKDKK